MKLWKRVSSRFNEWTPPLRPSPEDVDCFLKQIKPSDKVLLLGLTSELLPLAHTAIDNNSDHIEEHKEFAVCGDWSELPFDSQFDVIIGDGCLTVFQHNPMLLFKQAKKALKPGGKLILRVFISPEKKESLEFVINDKDRTGFHAFKWRVAQALANPYVNVKQIYKTIQPVWQHPTLDVYKGVDYEYYFPKLSELPKWSDIAFSKSYELAERCPIITWNL